MSKERGKIRGFFFEIEGDGETLQEGLKNFGAALGRALTSPARPTKALPGLSNNKCQDQNGDNNSETDDGAEVEEVEGELEDEFSPTPAKPKKPSARKPAKMPEVLSLDLEGTSGVTFKDYVAKKKPETISDRFLVVAAWLANYGGVKEVGVDHAFTCYKYMGWTPHPLNYLQIFKDLKRKQHKFDKGSQPNLFKLNLVGQNAVDEMGAEG